MNYLMEEMLLNIVDELRAGEIVAQAPDGSSYTPPEAEVFSRLIDRLGKGLPDAQDYSKQVLLAYYQETKEHKRRQWESWNIDPKLERRLLRILQTKPRRTASGVATITVITKPWRCGSDCLFCPNDVRMPKSYLSDEPACQRAERNFFDPYLQVQSRLQVLKRMGHLTDKIEIIVLGGSWCDYPKEYQLWFVCELYRALNDADDGQEIAARIYQQYLDAGFSESKEEIIEKSASVQERVNKGEIHYNQAIRELYAEQEAHYPLGPHQGVAPSSESSATDALDLDAQLEVLFEQQRRNELSQHRMVGFTVETRPDLVTADALVLLRKLGVTRLQIGVQGLDPEVLALNNRKTSLDQINEAFALARAFGFKIHGHFMQNLYGSNMQADQEEYLRFVTDPAYIPDEVKLYPCSLIEGTGLVRHYKEGSWQPYSEDELTELLAMNTVNTPGNIRISRMIRDISSHDIMAGSKRTNLRQLVEKRVVDRGEKIREIRFRELSNQEVSLEELQLDLIRYSSTVSEEYFLQWVTSDDRIAGFLRLSLPSAQRAEYLPLTEDDLPTTLDTAFIREVHVYGKVAAIDKAGEHAQHFGLGRRLIEKACEIAGDAGYRKINVISSVGTREYYRKLGFGDAELYQEKDL